jgi:hypothetical protein
VSEIVFVLAAGQNHFFFELAEALRRELGAEGVAARLSTSGFPEDEEAERVFVLLPPHEYFALEGARTPPPPGALRRTIMISAEQPETVHFRQNLALAGRGGAVFDINERAVQAYRRRGVPARRLRLGYTPAWDRYAESSPGERPDDVLFLGAYTPRRGRVLGRHAAALAGLRSRLVLSDNSRPNTAGTPGFLAGEEKWRALAGARMLLNVHQGREPYFEWHRVLQAIHCGAVVVTETATDFEPLRAGKDFEMAPAADLAEPLARLAADEGLRRERARSAYERIREAAPLRDAARHLAETAEELGAGRARRPTPRGRAASRLAALRLRVPPRGRRGPHHGRGAPALPGGWDADAAEAERLEGGDLLLIAPGQSLLPGGPARLRETLAATPAAAFSFGLVAGAGEAGVANPFAWEPARPVSPPVLVARSVAESAGAALQEGSWRERLAVLEAIGPGVNAESLVATGAAQPAQPAGAGRSRGRGAERGG